MKDEFFGTDEQRALLRRGRAMADLVWHDPRYSYYGRTVGLATPDDGGLDQLAALVQLQGNASLTNVPVHDTQAILSKLTDRALSPMFYAKWEGDKSCLVAATDVIRQYTAPFGVRLIQIDGTTSDAQLTAFEVMARECGVLPPSGAVLRGLLIPFVCMIAIDEAGAVLSCAAASTFAQPNHPTLGQQAWWGMLATDPAHRGQGLAVALGAHAMIEMERRHGLQSYMTGGAPGNAPSEAVCKRMGLARSGYDIISCADPTILTSGRMTK